MREIMLDCEKDIGFKGDKGLTKVFQLIGQNTSASCLSPNQPDLIGPCEIENAPKQIVEKDKTNVKLDIDMLSLMMAHSFKENMSILAKADSSKIRKDHWDAMNIARWLGRALGLGDNLFIHIEYHEGYNEYPYPRLSALGRKIYKELNDNDKNLNQLAAVGANTLNPFVEALNKSKSGHIYVLFEEKKFHGYGRAYGIIDTAGLLAGVKTGFAKITKCDKPYSDVPRRRRISILGKVFYDKPLKMKEDTLVNIEVL